MSTLPLERALQATARIAGVALALGCAPTVATVKVPELDAAATDDPDPQPEASCDVLLEELVSDQEGGDFSKPDDATLDCCEETLDEIETSMQWPTDQDGQAAHWACCSALDFPVGLACTPWGPPAPPSAVVPRPGARRVA